MMLWLTLIQAGEPVNSALFSDIYIWVRAIHAGK